jgi:hypothetical protein
MTKQKLTISIIGNESAAIYLMDELILGGFNIKAECGDQTWLIEAERDLPDDEPAETVH